MKRKTEIFTTVKLIAAIILAAIVTVLLTPIQTTKVLYRFFSIYFKEKKELKNAPDYWAKFDDILEKAFEVKIYKRERSEELSNQIERKKESVNASDSHKH